MRNESLSPQDPQLDLVDSPLLDGPVSLRQIYVSLRAYYSARKNAKGREPLSQLLERRAKEERIVVVLDEEIERWLEDSTQSDVIRLVAGAPGSGKTSFCAMLAARLQESGRFMPIYLPLGEVNPPTGVGCPLMDVLARTGRFSPDSLSLSEPHTPVLLILDGLDEMPSLTGERINAVRWLVTEAHRLSQELGGMEPGSRVLLTADESSVEDLEEEFFSGRQVLHLLPLCMSAASRRHFHDPKGLLEPDRQAEWWTLFSSKSGLDLSGRAMSVNGAAEATSRSLLHEYLAALAMMRGLRGYAEIGNNNAEFRGFFDSLATDLMELRNLKGPPSGVSNQSLMCLLEEAGFTAWQGNRRTIGIKEIPRRSTEPLSQAQWDAVVTLIEHIEGPRAVRLASPKEPDSSSRGLEFTHRCFVEYLAARWVVRTIEGFGTESSHGGDTGWRRNCLRRWMELCGQTPFDRNVLAFLRNEVLLHSDSAESWLDTLLDLLEYEMGNGMPTEDMVPRIPRSDGARQVRNAEEALLAAFNCCTRATNRVGRVRWPTKRSASEWLSRLQGQRVGIAVPLAFDCLSLIDFTECEFEVRDLIRSDMEGSVLDRSWLTWANLAEARLNHAHLEEAHLEGAHLSRAQLRGAHLDGAKLPEAHLREAHLEGAHLQSADLGGAHLREVHMEVANLRGARLAGAHFRKGWLTEADLRGADLNGARLLDTRFDGADLRGANLEGANLGGAVFVDADLRGMSPDVPLETTAEQLSKASTLYGARMDPELRGLIEERCPQVFAPPRQLNPAGFIGDCFA